MRIKELCKESLVLLNRLAQAPRIFVPYVRPASEIAKIIHQTGPRSSLAPEIQKNIDNLRALNPDWEYRFYSDEDIVGFIGDVYGEAVLRVYKLINPVYGSARADLFRYLVIYYYGGVYLDIKSTALKPLSRVIDSSDLYILSHWKNAKGEFYEGYGIHPDTPPPGEFQNWHVVAAKGHPALRSVIRRVLHNIAGYSEFIYGTGRYGVLSLTGPIAYTKVLNNLPRGSDKRVVDIEELGFKYSIFEDPTCGHRVLFERHYSDVAEPIARIGKVSQGVDNILKWITA